MKKIHFFSPEDIKAGKADELLAVQSPQPVAGIHVNPTGVFVVTDDGTISKEEYIQNLFMEINKISIQLVIFDADFKVWDRKKRELEQEKKTRELKPFEQDVLNVATQKSAENRAECDRIQAHIVAHRELIDDIRSGKYILP